MSRNYKNIIKKPRTFGVEERDNLALKTVENSTPIPNSLEYRDIDVALKEWVENKLDVSFEGKRLPTVALFSNQRFSEYLQTWADVDDKKNLLLNFKTITRENNPKIGSVYGQTRNIPGERTFLLKRVEARDRSNRKYFIDYKMKQPISIDLIYTINVVASKYELLNTFNLLVNEQFKAITAYIWPKGYPIAMNLLDVSDESEYSIDDRLFYSQAYNIKVMGYIMPKDNFIVEENPELKFIGFEGDTSKSSFAEITECPCHFFKEPLYDFIPVEIKAVIGDCDGQLKFEMDCYFKIEYATWDKQHFRFKLSVNDNEIPIENLVGLRLNKYDKVRFYGFNRFNSGRIYEIILQGFDPMEPYAKEEIENKN